MIYLDSSALLKLLHDEEESAAMEAWIVARDGTPMITSAISRIEVVRACRRIDVGSVPAARTLMAQIDLIPLSSAVIEDAADLDDPLLRSLDAIHLVSALSLGADLSSFVAYDQRLLKAARSRGLDGVRPGA